MNRAGHMNHAGHVNLAGHVNQNRLCKDRRHLPMLRLQPPDPLHEEVYYVRFKIFQPGSRHLAERIPDNDYKNSDHPSDCKFKSVGPKER